MRARTCFYFVLLVAGLAIPGCDRHSSQTGSASPPSTVSPDDANAVIDKVFEDHAVTADELSLTTAEVEQRLGSAQKWTEFSLREVGPGQYEGQAKSPKGELLNVEVRQTTNGIYSRWVNADDSGSGKSSIVW